MTLTSDRKRQRLLAHLTAWVFNLVRDEPLILVVEDLQWIDPSSMEVLMALVEQGAQAPLMLLCTARPEFRAAWSLRAHHAQAPLDRLTREETRELVVNMAAEVPLDQDLIEAMIGRTDGVPLFAVELTRLMLGGERGGPRHIPETLVDSLQARLARTGPARETAMLGAVLGREFSYRLLEAVAQRPSDELRAHLARLGEAELIYARGVPPDATYQFKHALILDAAYDALPRGRRRELHALAAQALVDRFPDVAATRPDLLAAHWLEAGEHGKAVDAWLEAGALVAGRHAYREAEQSYRAAIEVLLALAPSPECDARELQVLVLLSEVVGVIYGHAGEEYAEMAERMADVAERSGALAQMVFQMLGRYISALMSGQHRKAAVIADQFLDLARREGSDASLRMGYMAQISSRHALGDMVAAEAFIGPWGEIVARSGPSPFLGENAAVHGVSVETAYMLGQVALAQARAERLVATAEHLGSPFELATALQTAAWCAVLCEDFPQACELASRALTIARDNNFHTANQITCTLAWATARLGDAVQGLALIEGCFEGWSGGGYPRLPEARRLHAQIRALAGDVAGGLAALDELCAVEADNVTVGAAHLIARGELRLSAGEVAAGEADLRAVIDRSRQLRTPTLELRAAFPLAASLVARGRGAEARDLLTPVQLALEGEELVSLRSVRSLLAHLA